MTTAALPVAPPVLAVTLPDPSDIAAPSDVDMDDEDDYLPRSLPPEQQIAADRAVRAATRALPAQSSLFEDLFEAEMASAPVPWSDPSAALMQVITKAPWKSVDLETTGLTPASIEQKFSVKERATGIDTALRARVITITYPDDAGDIVTAGFDLDLLSAAEQTSLAQACLSNAIIGHNIGFDLYWLYGKAGPGHRPSLVLDTMLLSRALRPDITLIQAQMVTDSALPEHLQEAARSIFIQDRSGWSLSDIALALLHRPLDKSLQGPKNWCKVRLTQADFEYATGDASTTLEVLTTVLGCEPGEDVLKKYHELRKQNKVLRMLEPQVDDVVKMRQRGMPWNANTALAYIDSQHAVVRAGVAALIEIEPSLEPWRANLESMDEGVKADLRKAVGQAFQRRGLVLAVTEKAGVMKVGEKDLRRAKAEMFEDSRVLFKAWIGFQRAKKAANMARDFTGFSGRSGDSRIHSLTGHGPVTGRLGAAEPNVQQCPRDEGFRACVKAHADAFMIASDYSALDMRVGAALAIRAQRRIQDAYEGKRDTPPDVLACIRKVKNLDITLEGAIAAEALAVRHFEQLKGKRDEISRVAEARPLYWHQYRKAQRAALLARFTRTLAYVQAKAKEAGTPEWGSLRIAFQTPGMDIHSWTALGMTGQDPGTMFKGLSGEDVVAKLKICKAELGDKRLTGKVGNLSLLYAMQSYGLQDAAGRLYNIHWTFEEADKVRRDWFAAYVEVDLWHAWTELNPHSYVNVPDFDRGGKMAQKTVYASETLGDRLIYAFSLNAALSYEDQSTGADILGSVMDTLYQKHPDIAACIVNQIHDEVLFETPRDVAQEHERIIGEVMQECAEAFTMQFGVHCEATPATGYTWLKEPPKVSVFDEMAQAQPPLRPAPAQRPSMRL